MFYSMEQIYRNVTLLRSQIIVSKFKVYTFWHQTRGPYPSQDNANIQLVFFGIYCIITSVSTFHFAPLYFCILT